MLHPQYSAAHPSIMEGIPEIPKGNLDQTPTKTRNYLQSTGNKNSRNFIKIKHMFEDVRTRSSSNNLHNKEEKDPVLPKTVEK